MKIEKYRNQNIEHIKGLPCGFCRKKMVRVRAHKSTYAEHGATLGGTASDFFTTFLCDSCLTTINCQPNTVSLGMWNEAFFNTLEDLFRLNRLQFNIYEHIN